MRIRTMTSGSVALVLLIGTTMAAAKLKSGPQAGDTVPGPFHVLNVNGPSAGEKNCQV